MQGSRAGATLITRSALHLQIGGVIIVRTLQVKCRYQLVVKLKAIECYERLLYYLSFLYHFLDFKQSRGLDILLDTVSYHSSILI